MPTSIVDKVMEEWVYSGKLQAMRSAQVEEAIHENAAEVTARAKGQFFFEPTPRSLSLPSGEGTSPVTSPLVVKSTTEPLKQPRKKRAVLFLNSEETRGILLGPGSLRKKAEQLGASFMTVKRRLAELRKGEK